MGKGRTALAGRSALAEVMAASAQTMRLGNEIREMRPPW
jgi:hypothetical protein